MHLGLQASDVPPTTIQGPADAIVNEFPGPRCVAHAHAHPPTYTPSLTPAISEQSSALPNTAGLSGVRVHPYQTVWPPTERPSLSTGTTGPPAGTPYMGRGGGSGNVCMHANYNYSNPTIYPNMASAAGLSYGTPFGSPKMPPRQMEGPGPVLSSHSTGNYPFQTALDGMQNPSLGPAAMGEAYVDAEMFAEVQRNASAWKPAWDVFPLKVYRGYDLKVITVQRDWDDEDLLRELGAAYDKLRGRLRKYFSFKDVWLVSPAMYILHPRADRHLSLYAFALGMSPWSQ